MSYYFIEQFTEQACFVFIFKIHFLHHPLNVFVSTSCINYVRFILQQLKNQVQNALQKHMINEILNVIVQKAFLLLKAVITNCTYFLQNCPIKLSST